MKKISYPVIGVTALGLHVLGGLLTYVAAYLGYAFGLENILLFVGIAAAVLAEVWAIMFWRAQRGKLAVVVVALVTLMVAARLLQIGLYLVNPFRS